MYVCIFYMKTMRNTVIYTCIIENYDSLMNPVAVDPEFDYICFVKKGKKLSEKAGIWEIREVDINDKNPVILSRYPKINPHILLPEYKYSVWIDGNILIKDMFFFDAIREKIKNGIPYSGMKHWERDCAYEEIEACLDARIESRIRLIKALAFLKMHKFPKHYGLYENNVIFRCHNDPDIIRFDSLWWHFFTNFTYRDQIMHPYCMQKCGISFDYLLPPPYCSRNHWSLQCIEHSMERKYYWHRHNLNKKLNSIIKKFI